MLFPLAISSLDGDQRSLVTDLIAEMQRSNVDARGMGVRNEIILGMRAHNNTEPDFIEEENRFTVRLWKDPEDIPAYQSL